MKEENLKGICTEIYEIDCLINLIQRVYEQ